MWSTLHNSFLATERAEVLRGTERGRERSPRDSHRTKSPGPGQQQPEGQEDMLRQAIRQMQKTSRTPHLHQSMTSLQEITQRRSPQLTTRTY